MPHPSSMPANTSHEQPRRPSPEEGGANVSLTLDDRVRLAELSATRLVETARQQARLAREAATREQQALLRAETLQRRCNELERENGFLRMGAAMAPTRAQALEMKGVLSGLMREIDKCIALLADAPPAPEVNPAQAVVPAPANDADTKP